MNNLTITKRYRLYTLIMLLIPMVILGFAVTSLFSNEILQRFSMEQMKALQTIKENSIDKPIMTLEGILENYSHDSRLFAPLDDKEKSVIQNEWNNLSGILGWNFWIFYLDKEYKLLESHPRDHFATYHHQVLSSLESREENHQWVKLQPETGSGELIFSTAVQLESEDGFAGIIGIDISLHSFFSHIKYESLREGTKLLGLVKNGDVINFKRSPSEPIEYSSLYDWSSLIQNEKKWSLIFLGSNSFYAFSLYLEALDMYLISLVPSELFIDEITPLLIILVAVILVSTLIAFFGSSLVSNRFLSNIEQLTRYIGDVSEGTFETRICIEGKDEFLDLNIHLNHMIQSLGSFIDLRETLLHLISHNSSTPITLLINNSRDLLEEDPEKVEYNQIFSTSQSLRTLMDNMMLYLRLEEGNSYELREIIELKETTDLTCSLFAPILCQKKLEIIIAGDEVEILANRFLVRMAIENLIDNAAKYSAPQGTIKIDISRKPGAVEWTIYDNGPGIPSYEEKLLFRKFSKTSNTPTGGEKSTGLGLYLVKKMMLLIGGDIFYLPEEKCFTLHFPD